MSRFETLQTLGAGAFGQVSLVRERETGKHFAMKIAHPYAQAQITARMRREYRALAKLQHNNVVQVYEFGTTEDGRPFITLEYIDGSTLEVWLRHKPSQPHILEVFLALADALGAVHQAGLLHRDLKPDNVMITQAGVVKLMDFGLTKLEDDSLQLTKAGAMLGTVLYMSPEQCKGLPLDARSDWYAFGIMLYRALCGQMPFLGQTMVEVVMAHLQKAPTPPRDHNPEIGVALNDFVVRLLAKSPSERPNSAETVRQELLAALEQPAELGNPTAPRADFLLQVPVLGRDNELLSLQAATQTGGLVVVCGTAGIGKTALLSSLQQQSAQLCVQSAALAEETTPFGIVSRLIETLHTQNLLHDAPPEQRAIWQQLAPRVGFGAPTNTLSSDPALGKLQLLEGFRHLLAHCATAIMVLEDIHWSDEASLELLRYALPLVPEARVVVSYRKEELKKSLPAAKLSLELKPLTTATMQDLIQGWLGAPVEMALGEELLRGTGGNPWFLRERLSSMIQEGNIVQRLGVFEWTRSAVYLPDSVAGLLEKRVQDLNSRTLEFAQAASIFGQQFEFTDVQRLLEWSEDACFDALEELLKVHLIAEHKADTFSFTHPSFADALLSKILGVRARLWHRRAAGLLAARAERDIFALAKHYFLGGEPEKTVPLALENAEDCLLRFAYPQAENAFRLAQEALKDAPNPRQELRLQQGLAQTLYALGHVKEAFLLWESALKNAILKPQTEQQLRLELASARSTQGNYGAALEVLEDLENPEAWLERADCYQRSGQNDLAVQFGSRALQAFQTEQNLSGQSRALTILSWADYDTSQHTHGLVLAEMAVDCAKDHAYLQMLAYQVQSAHQYRIRDFAAMKKTYQVVLALPMTRTQLQHQVWFDMGMANLLLFEDQLPQAERLYQQVYTNAKRAEAHDQVMRSAFSLVLLHHMQDQLKQATDHLETIPHPAIVQLWHCRFALANGSQIAMPPDLENLPAWTHGLWRITHLEWLLASEQYEMALTQCANPDDEYQWFWCLGKLHAQWATGLDYRQTLHELESPMKDSGLANSKREEWTPLIHQALIQNTKALAHLEQSAIGVFARATRTRVT